MRSSRLPSSSRWRLRGDTRCVCFATKSPRSIQKTLAGGTADDGGSPIENFWTSAEAFQAALVLFADVPSRRINGQRVPLGVETAALALAWHRQTEALRRVVRDAHVYVLGDSMPVLAWP